MTAFRFEQLEPQAEHMARFRLNVPASSSFFEGHFDGDPILPGVVQICDIVLDRIEVVWPFLGAPTSIPRLKFTLPIRPDSELELDLERNPSSSTVRFSLRANGAPASSGILRFAAE